jgi:putative membrane protein
LSGAGLPEKPPEVFDPRVLQANERTLLAWLRTGIALMAFGFVVARFGAWLRLLRPDVESGAPSFAWVGVALVAFGAAANAAAAWRYHRVRQAILLNRPTALGEVAAVALAAGLALVGVALCAMLMARL